MLQIIFLNIGLCVILLAIAFVFKKYARVILWSSAITLFVGTLLLVGLGVVNPVSDNETGSSEFWGTIMFLISAAALVIGAEILREKNIKNVEEVVSVDAEIILSETLDTIISFLLMPFTSSFTELARKVFAKAIEAGYMKEDGTHYIWNESKVLLAYMCGRIYCGDKPTVSNIDDREFWKFGRTAFFPDTELNNLFDVSGLGQSRSNRKDLPVPTKSTEIDKFFE
jgi:hypothetical protein